MGGHKEQHQGEVDCTAEGIQIPAWEVEVLEMLRQMFSGQLPRRSVEVVATLAAQTYQGPRGYFECCLGQPWPMMVVLSLPVEETGE